MANKNPNPFPQHTWWKKGQSGNPNGRPRTMLSRDRVENVIGEISAMTTEEVTALAANPETSMIKATIAAIYVMAKKRGDSARMNFLLDRSIGKPRELQGDPNDWQEVFKELTPEQIALFFQERQAKKIAVDNAG